MPVVGYLGSSAPGPTVPWTAAFRQWLSETGYVEGQNLAIEYRWAESRYDRLPALAADLVRRNVDVIAAGGTPAALAAKWATQTIPIVFMGVGDPVGSGLVAGLARPGGNLTGISEMTTDLMSKRLELLFEMVPQATVIALLVNPNIAITEGVIREVQAAAGATGGAAPYPEGRHRKRDRCPLRGPRRTSCRRACYRPGCVLLQPARAAPWAVSRDAVPAIYHLREFAAAGGLITYGASLTAVFRQAGIYAGRVLKGAKPADLPVQQPTTFELVVNLSTAKALGLTVPPSILSHADEVIE